MKFSSVILVFPLVRIKYTCLYIQENFRFNSVIVFRIILVNFDIYFYANFVFKENLSNSNFWIK